MGIRPLDPETIGARRPRAPLAWVLEFSREDAPEDPYAFRFEPQGYTLRTPGGGRERFDIGWDERLLADLEALRRPGRDPACVQRVGELLRRSLKSAGWDELGRQILAAHQGGARVLVTLRSSAAELYALPWELVTVGATGQHLGELSGVLLRQEWPATVTTGEEPCPRPEGGRILLAWSAAGGGVPAAEHLRAISEACTKGHVPFDPSRDVLAHATAAGIADALAEAQKKGQPFAALHLLCHGARIGSTFGLALDAGPGTAALVDAGRVRQLLAPHTKTLRLVVLAACDGGNSGDAGNHLGSVAQALHRAGVQSVVASRYPLSVAGSVALTEALYGSLLVDLDPLEEALCAARGRLTRDAQSLDWASVQLYAREADGNDTRPLVFRPYRGLLSFDAEHRRFFFGRDAERRETLGDLQALIDAGKPRLIVVAGASGTGKSSMVLSGVVPDVEALKTGRPGPWEVAVMRPGDRSLDALTATLAGRVDERRPLLLVVDQFEELFTHGDDPQAREAFVRRLWSLAQDDTGVHCILTIRVDFLARCGEFVLDESGICLDRIAYDEAHRVFVARMGREQVRAAIEGPAARAGLSLAPGLTDQLLADVGNEPGALPLLQYALDRLWLRRVGRTLSIEVYGELGGLVGALETKADGLIEGLAEGQRRHARRLLTRLVGIGDDEGVDTRRRVELGQLEPAEASARAAFQDVLDQLVDARLVVRNEEHGEPGLEIAHEALIRRWTRLRGWLTEDRGKLAELENFKEWLAQWDRHGTLLSGAQLGYAAEILRRWQDDADERARELVRLSAARERFIRNISWAINTLMAIGVLALAGLTYYARGQTALANDRLAAAKQLSNEILTEVLPRYESIPGTADVRRDIHARLESLQQTLRTGAEDDPDLLHMQIQEKIKRGELSETHERHSLAREEYEQALVIAETLVDQRPEDVMAQHDLATALRRLGDVERKAGDPAAARAQLGRSLAVAEALAAKHASDPRALRLLALSLGSAGLMELEANDLPAARSRLERARDVYGALAASVPLQASEQGELARVLRQLGATEMYAGNLDHARVHIERARTLDEARVAADPTSAAAQIDLTDSLRRLGEIESQTGDVAAARAHFGRYLQIAEALVKADPASVREQRYLCDALDLVAGLEPDLSSARGLLDRSREIRYALARADPSSQMLQQDVFISEHTIGVRLGNANELASARAPMQRAVQLAERLAETDPARNRRLLVAALNSLGDLERRVGDTNAARTHLQRALQISEALAAEDPENTEPQLEISFGLRTLGEVEELAGDRESAREHLMRAHEIAAAQVRRTPTGIDARRELSHVLAHLGTMEGAAGELAGARAHIMEAAELLDALVTADPTNLSDRTNLWSDLEALGDLAVTAGDLAAARSHFGRLARLVEVRVQADPHDTDLQRILGVALRKSGDVDQKLDELSAARVDYDRSLSILEALRHEHPDDGDIAFAVVEVRLQFADLAEQEGGATEQRLHLAAAKEVLDGMDARGQIAGVVQRERARDLVRRALGRTRPSGPRPR